MIVFMNRCMSLKNNIKVEYFLAQHKTILINEFKRFQLTNKKPKPSSQTS